MLGRRSISILPKHRALKYWLKLISSEENRLIRSAYDYQRRAANQNLPCWALDIKNLLNKIGLSYLWVNQDNINVNDHKGIERLLKKKLFDINFSELMSTAETLKTTKHLRSIATASSPLPWFNYLKCKSM